MSPARRQTLEVDFITVNFIAFIVEMDTQCTQCPPPVKLDLLKSMFYSWKPFISDNLLSLLHIEAISNMVFLFLMEENKVIQCFPAQHNTTASSKSWKTTKYLWCTLNLASLYLLVIAKLLPHLFIYFCLSHRVPPESLR